MSGLDPAARAALLEQLEIDAEHYPGARAFAVLDGARDPAIHAALEAQGPPRACLFAGAMPPKLAAAAPWLVELEGSPAARDLVVDRGWGQSWGTFVVSAASLGELRKHFRRFLQVKRKGAGKLFFRFYDPRVLRVFLPTCDRQQLSVLFGPVSEYVVEGDAPDVLLRYALGEGGLVVEEARLRPAAPAAPAAPPADLELEALVRGVHEAADGPTAAVRVRDALARRPGEARLLGALDAVAARFPEDAPRGQAVRAALERLGADATPAALLTELRPHVAARWEALFAAVAPSVRAWLPPADHARLAATCRVLADAVEVLERAEALRKELRDEATADARAQAAKDELEALHARTAAWPKPLDGFAEAVASNLKRLVGRLGMRRALDGKAVVSGLTSFLVSVKAYHGDGRDPSLLPAAQGLAAALGATAPPAAPPAQRRPRRAPAKRERATMKRKKLPFERDELVITEEQLTAMAEAQERALLEALVRRAREAHAARFEALGEARVRAVAARCLEKAAARGIQKKSAVEALFDPMLTIDPEFEELEEYRWARELLDNDMLDPDAKPRLIARRLADPTDE